MTITLKPHVFHDVFVSLVHDGELITLRRLLGVVATQETRILATLLKNRNTIIPRDALEIYSMQYVRIVSDEHMLTASNVALFVMYAQVFNEGCSQMQMVKDSEQQDTLKRYLINMFEEMCSRFLDDRLCEDQNQICRSKNRETCYALSGSCTLRVLLNLVSCRISMPNKKTSRLGDEIFCCIQHYMNIVSAEALHEDPDSAGFTTPTKVLFHKRHDERGNIIQNLLTPFEVHPQLNLNHHCIEPPQRKLCLNDDMQTLLKFLVHAIMEIRMCHRNPVGCNESGDIFSMFVRNACNIKLSEPCREVLWGKAHSICFIDYGDDEGNETLIELEPYILEQKGNTISGYNL